MFHFLKIKRLIQSFFTSTSVTQHNVHLPAWVHTFTHHPRLRTHSQAHSWTTLSCLWSKYNNSKKKTHPTCRFQSLPDYLNLFLCVWLSTSSQIKWDDFAQRLWADFWLPEWPKYTQKRLNKSINKSIDKTPFDISLYKLKKKNKVRKRSKCAGWDLGFRSGRDKMQCVYVLSCRAKQRCSCVGVHTHSRFRAFLGGLLFSMFFLSLFFFNLFLSLFIFMSV